MNPWIGVIVITLGLGVTLALILTNNAVPASVGAVITAGIGLLQAAGHGQARELAIAGAPVPLAWRRQAAFAPRLSRPSTWLPRSRASIGQGEG